MIDERDDDPMGPEAGGEGRGLLPKTLQKALLTGVSAVLMTEEGIRNALSDMRLPKEAIGYVVQQTERSRKDLFQAVSKEVKGFLDSVDMAGALRKALTGLKVEVRAELRFSEDGDGKPGRVQSTVKTTVQSSPSDEPDRAEEDAAAGAPAPAPPEPEASKERGDAPRRRGRTRR